LSTHYYPRHPHFDKVPFTELAEDFLVDYRVNATKSLDDAQRSVKSLLGFFEEMRATEITTATIKGALKSEWRLGSPPSRGCSVSPFNAPHPKLGRFLIFPN